MARRQRRAQEGGYNYLVTYGDMVTLLLCFFVLLFALSSVDEIRWASLVEDLTGVPPTRVISAIDPLENPIYDKFAPFILTPPSGIPADKPLPDDPLPPEKTRKTYYMLKTASGETVAIHESEIEQKAVALDPDTVEIAASPEYIAIELQFRALFESLQEYIRAGSLENMLNATRDQDTIQVSVTSGVLFDSGSDSLLPDHLLMLDQLEAMLAETLDSIGFIRIEGHTDSIPISTAEFADNRDLSSARANSVVRYIESKGRIPSTMILGIGHGEFDPIAPNDTEENRQKNRRVQFILSKKALLIDDIQSGEELP